jgi:hypothetical protein
VQQTWVALNEAFEALTSIHQQMKSIRDLLGLGSRPLRCLGILAGSVTTDHPQLRVAAKPRFDGGTAAILEQIDRLVGLQIDNDRAIGFALAKGKVIQPNLGRYRMRWERLPLQLPTKCRDRGRQMQSARQPVCHFMSRCYTQGEQRRTQPLRHARSWQQEGWESFGKDATSTGRLATEESAGSEQHTQQMTATGNIANHPLIAAMLSCRGSMAHRTARPWVG